MPRIAVWSSMALTVLILTCSAAGNGAGGLVPPRGRAGEWGRAGHRGTVGRGDRGGRGGGGVVWRLRGGGEPTDSTALLARDPMLRQEVLHDIARAEEGKLPLFIEKMGQQDEEDAYGVLDAAEAQMPAPIGGEGDLYMQEEEGERPSMVRGEETDLSWVGRETEEHRKERYAREAEDAKRYFAEIDAKYYTEPEENDEDIIGQRGAWQRRELPDDDLEDYFEARKAAKAIESFYKAIPPHLEAESPEFAKWLDDYGWNDMIHRNGTRFKWTPEFRANEGGMEPVTEWSGMKMRDLEWFRDTVTSIIRGAWALPPGSDYWRHYRGMNETFDELARMHTLLNDTVVFDLRDELEDEAEGDAQKEAAMEEFWALCQQKWKEFFEGPPYDGEVEQAMADIEAERIKKFGPPEYSHYWTEPRQQFGYGDDSSD